CRMVRSAAICEKKSMFVSIDGSRNRPAARNARSFSKRVSNASSSVVSGSRAQGYKRSSKPETPGRWRSIRLRVHLGSLQYIVTLLLVLSQGAERLERGLSAKPQKRCSCRGGHRSECSPERRPEADCEASKPVAQIA